MDIVYLAFAAVVALAAVAILPWKQLHPLGRVLSAIALALAVAALCTVSSQISLINAFGLVSEVDDPAPILAEAFQRAIEFTMAGLGGTLVVALLAGIVWLVHSRRAPYSPQGQLILTILLVLVGLALLLQLGLIEYAFSGVKKGILISVPESLTDRLPEGEQALAVQLQEAPLGQVAGDLSQTMVVSVAAALVFALVMGGLAILGLVISIWAHRARPDPDTAELYRTTLPGWTRSAVWVLIGALVLGCSIQIYRLWQPTHWLALIDEVDEPSSAPAPEPTLDELWVHHVRPAYPEVAREQGVNRQVLLRVTVDPQGNVIDAQVELGHPLLNQAAIDAVLQWKLRPELLTGAEENQSMTVGVDFQ